MQGVCTPPAVAIKELEALARTLDEAADSVVRGMGEQGSAAAVLIVYRRDYDVPPSRGLRTVRCHLALVRRVAERRPDVQFVTYDRHPYRHWLGSRPDTAAMRNAWAASRVSGRQQLRARFVRGGSPRPYGMWDENAISHPPREVELG
jgi:hypothetical protein